VNKGCQPSNRSGVRIRSGHEPSQLFVTSTCRPARLLFAQWLCQILLAILSIPGVIAILWSAPPSRKELVKCLFFPELAAGGSLFVVQHNVPSDVLSALYWQWAVSRSTWFHNLLTSHHFYSPYHSLAANAFQPNTSSSVFSTAPGILEVRESPTC
jgi:hypothetical protein